MATTTPIGRRILRWAGLCLASVVVLIVLVLVFLALPPGERLIKGFAESRLEAALNQRVTIAGLETNLFSRLQLTDLRVHAPGDSSLQSVIHVRHLSLRYDPWGLLRRELRLTSLVVDSVTVAVARDTTSRSNLTLVDSLDLILADTTPLPIAITLDTLRLTNLNCDLRDDLLGWQARVRGAEIQLRGEADGTYRYRLSIPQTVAVYDSIPVDLTAFVCMGSWHEDRLNVDTLGLSLDGLALSGHASYTFPDSSIVGEITLAGWPEALLGSVANRYALPPIVSEGSLQCLIEAYGTAARPQVRLQATTPPLQYNKILLGSGHLAAAFANDTLAIDSVTVGLGQGTVAAQGRIAVDSTMWSDLHLHLAAFDIRQLATLASGKKPPISGTLQGEATLTGPIDDWSALNLDSRLRTRNLRYESRPIPDVSARASLLAGMADVEITGGGVTLNASGWLQEESIRGEFHIEVPDLGTVAPAVDLADVTGAVTVNGSVSGTQAAPIITATAVGQDIRYRNWPLDSLSTHLRYERESLYVENAVFGGAWEATDSAHALLDLPVLTGALSYRGNASGPVASLEGNVEIDVHDFGTRDGPQFSGRTAVAIHGGRTATLTSHLTMDSLPLTIDGQADLIDSAASVTVVVHAPPGERPSDSRVGAGASSGTVIAEIVARASGIGSDRFAMSCEGRIDDLAALSSRLSDSLGVFGRAAFAVAASGTLNDPHVECDLQVHEALYDIWPLDSLFAHMEMNRETVRCDSLTAFTPAGRATVFAEIPIQRDTATFYAPATSRPGRGTMQIPEWDLAMFRPALPDGADISGRMEANLRWEGVMDAPAVEGWVTLAGVRFAGSPDTLPVENVQARISFADSVATIEHLTGSLRGFPFDVSGWVGRGAQDEFRGTIDCDLAELGTAHAQGAMLRDTLEITVQTQALRLATLSPFVPTMRVLRGSVDANLHVYGTRTAPQAEGRVVVSDLSLCHPMLDSCLTDGSVALSFSGNRVQIDTLSASYGQGTVTASGWAVYADTTLSAADMSLRADQIRFQRPRLADVAINSVQLRFRKDGEESSLQGDVILGQSRVLARVRPQALVPWARSVERTRPPLPPMLQNTRLDLRVRASDSLWIDNNLGRIRLSLALAATGNVARPALAGRVGIEEGYLLYLDRRFTVREGQLLFADPETINPEIILRAETRVTTYSGMIATPYVVTIVAEGTPADLTVDLYSDPALDKADILALLTVGATRSQFSGEDQNGQGGTRDVLFARSAELAGQRVAGFLSNRVGGALGLDEVSVEGNIFRTSGPDTARLLASRRLGGRLKLTYSTAVGHLNDQALRLNYNLSRRFSLEGQTTQQGRSVLGIQYSVPIK